MSIAGICINRDAPFFQEPLRYVISIPIFFAPPPQFARADVLCFCQTKPQDLVFKVGLPNRLSRGRLSTGPVPSLGVREQSLLRHLVSVGE
jgi:hypothetical protein